MLDQNTKRLGSPTKEIGALSIRREIEEPEGYVLTPRDEDLYHSVFGAVAIMPAVFTKVFEIRVVGDGLSYNRRQFLGLINGRSST